MLKVDVRVGVQTVKRAYRLAILLERVAQCGQILQRITTYENHGENEHQARDGMRSTEKPMSIVQNANVIL